MIAVSVPRSDTRELFRERNYLSATRLFPVQMLYFPVIPAHSHWKEDLPWIRR